MKITGKKSKIKGNKIKKSQLSTSYNENPSSSKEKKIKRIAIIVVILILVLSYQTIYSQNTEPRKWTSDPHMLSTYLYYKENPQNFSQLYKMQNYTENFGDMKAVLFTLGDMQQNQYTFPVPSGFGGYYMFSFCFKLESYHLSFPWDSLSIKTDSWNLSSNGTVFVNLPINNYSNILTPLHYDYGHLYYNNSNVPDGVCSSYYAPFYNESYHLNPGNYTMYFTYRFTPILEFGPYYLQGNEMSISNTWEWNITSVPGPPYV